MDLHLFGGSCGIGSPASLGSVDFAANDDSASGPDAAPFAGIASKRRLPALGLADFAA